MSDLDALILSTEAEIAEAKNRLKILKSMKEREHKAAWVKASDAAQQIGISSRTIPVWCMDGRLEGKHNGRLWYVSQESIDRYIGGF